MSLTHKHKVEVEMVLRGESIAALFVVLAALSGCSTGGDSVESSRVRDPITVGSSSQSAEGYRATASIGAHDYRVRLNAHALVIEDDARTLWIEAEGGGASTRFESVQGITHLASLHPDTEPQSLSALGEQFDSALQAKSVSAEESSRVGDLLRVALAVTPQWESDATLGATLRALRIYTDSVFAGAPLAIDTGGLTTQKKKKGSGGSSCTASSGNSSCSVTCGEGSQASCSGGGGSVSCGCGASSGGGLVNGGSLALSDR